MWSDAQGPGSTPAGTRWRELGHGGELILACRARPFLSGKVCNSFAYLTAPYRCFYGFFLLFFCSLFRIFFFFSLRFVPQHITTLFWTEAMYCKPVKRPILTNFSPSWVTFPKHCTLQRHLPHISGAIPFCSLYALQKGDSEQATKQENKKNILKNLSPR